MARNKSLYVTLAMKDKLSQGINRARTSINNFATSTSAASGKVKTTMNNMKTGVKNAMKSVEKAFHEKTGNKFVKMFDGAKVGLKNFQRNVKRTVNNIKKDFNNMVQNVKTTVTNGFSNLGNKAVSGLKGLAAAGAGAATAAIGAGMAEGMSYETYRVQLQTATKDTEKTAKLMSSAIQLANKTPFETGTMVEATSKFESMGLSAEKWLSITADMAGATSKDVIQATEAIIDAVASGEFERLKEFGIKKDSLAGFDASGALVDQNAMVDSLMSQMQDRFKGGAEALSQTTKGMWSTVTGVFKNGMAKVVGVMDNGEVRSGSILEGFKQKIQKLGDTLVKWQQNGTFERIGKAIEKMGQIAKNVFTKIVNIGKQLFNQLAPYVVQAFSTIKEVINNIVTSDAFAKTINVIKTVFEEAKMIFDVVVYKVKEVWNTLKETGVIQNIISLMQTIYNVAATIFPYIITAIGTVIQWAIDLAGNIIQAVATVWQGLRDGVLQFCEWWWNLFSGLGEFLSIFINGIATGFSGLWEGLKNGVKGFCNFFIRGINACIKGINRLFSFTVPDWIPVIGGKSFAVNIPTIPEFATGTSYHRGGLARINEGGRGEIVNLPNGSQVIPHQLSKQMLSGNNNDSINININIGGNVYGEQDLVNRVGSQIAQRVKLAITNV